MSLFPHGKQSYSGRFNYGEDLEQLFRVWGWREGKNLFGAPFDWRFSESGLGPYYSQLQALIEQAYHSTGGQRVHILSVSYGPGVVLAFLRRMKQWWKDKYVAYWIADSPVWAGAPVSVYSMINGLDLDPKDKQSRAGDTIWRQVISHIPAPLWLSPRPVPVDSLLVSTPEANYSYQDVPRLLRDMGMGDDRVQEYTTVQEGVLRKFEAPLVDTFISYGYQVDTPAAFYYTHRLGRFAPKRPHVVSSSGDGIVLVESSNRSTVWAEAQAKAGKQLIQRGYKNMLHGSCTVVYGPFNEMSRQCFQTVLTLLSNSSPPAPSSAEDTDIGPTAASDSQVKSVNDRVEMTIQ